MVRKKTTNKQTKKYTNKKIKNNTNKKIKPCSSNVIYLDNNGTTKLCEDAKKSMYIWSDSRANPSSDSILSKPAKKLLLCTRRYIAKHCGVSLNSYKIIFTSGASESNCLILKSTVDAYKKHTGKIPHIITSSTEHVSIIKCCNFLKNSNRASITFIEPNAYGNISPLLIKKAILPSTALISIMSANNEIGCINDIKKIGSIANEHKIPFHTDAVQLFGKYRILLKKNNIDALSMSFHKLYGPMGIGMLIINNDLIEGYGLDGQISGMQQNELRGGTENVPAIAGSFSCMEYTFKNRDIKNKKMISQKNLIINDLRKEFHQGEYKKYFEKTKPINNEFIILGPINNKKYKNPNLLPNTLLISFVKNDRKNKTDAFCNVNLKKYLDKKNIIISIGSTCSTDKKKASHVLSSIKAPHEIKQGVIRISLSDNTTNKDIKKFTTELIRYVKKQFNK